jgi:hypothetical protein
MSFTRWMSSAQRPLHSRKPARRRHPVNPLSGHQNWLLEDRCLMSRAVLAHRNVKEASQSTIYVASRDGDSTLGPYTLENVAANAGAVIFLGGTSPNTPGVDWGTVPTKSVTFTNNSNNKETIYPFVYSPNNAAIYDPIDQTADEYRLYIGYQAADGKYVLGLPYGKSITVSVPLVFWNGGRADIATDGSDLIPKPSQVNTLNPYEFRYTASTFITTQGVTKSDDNGILMYYKANTVNAPNDPSSAAPGQLTEWTIRDQAFLTKVNQYDQDHNLGTIPASELTTLVNYDVSYVDDMTSPVAMKALNVPVPIQYIQNGTATTQGGTTTITLPDSAAAFNTLLTKTYPYRTAQWQVKYNEPGSTTSIAVGTVTNISNGAVTVVSSGPVSGLPTSLASYVFYTNSVVQDYGWTGANNDINQMQTAMLDFTTDNTNKQPNINGLGQYFGGLGWPKYYNPDPNALLKIPSGANILINSPLTTKTSPFDINRYLLTSGNKGRRIFYDTSEVLKPNQNQPLNQGDTVTFTVTGPDLEAISAAGGTWLLSKGLDTSGTNTIGKITSINVADNEITVKLAQTITYNASGYSFPVVSPPSDPYTTKLTNLWYSWANYYVNQFTGAPPSPVNATVSADTDSTTDTRILSLSTDAQLAVGMSVATANGQPVSGLTTILKIVESADGTQEQLYLSAPVLVGAGQTVPFTFTNPQPIGFSNDPGLDENLLNNVDFGADASFAKQFAGSVYELLSNYSTVPVNHSQLPNRSMDVVYEAIGGNVGFLPSNVNTLTAITADVRDLGKSVLRGVPNFITYSNQGTDAQWVPGFWYPPPSKDMYSTGYNVYNLDPFVWFVHQKVGLSGYGFSFDDDVSDVGAGGASALAITNAPGATNFPQKSQWFPSTPWGNVTAMATISQDGGNSVLTIVPQDVKAYWQLKANDKPSGLIGAYISTTTAGINIPSGTNLQAGLDSNLLTYQLSQNVTTTTTPIPITFTAYEPATPAALRLAKRRR